METLLVFLAIIAIQMLAAYAKQKKEAERKKQRVPEHNIPQEAIPIPDPFKEIRKAMGLPSSEMQEELEEEQEELVLEEVPMPEYKNEGFAPQNMPFQSITERKLKKNAVHTQAETQNFVPTQAGKFETDNSIDINNIKQGILWTAILQQPRFRAKWKPLATSY
jgi:hypothetical protein